MRTNVCTQDLLLQKPSDSCQPSHCAPPPKCSNCGVLLLTPTLSFPFGTAGFALITLRIRHKMIRNTNFPTQKHYNLEKEQKSHRYLFEMNNHSSNMKDPCFSLNLQWREALIQELQHASQISAANIAQVLQLQTTSTAPRSSRNLTLLVERHQLVVFVKVLFKYLEKSKATSLRMRAKKVIADCIRENRAGTPAPLADVIKQRLYRSLGERHWYRANACYVAYCTKRQSCRVST